MQYITIPSPLPVKYPRFLQVEEARCVYFHSQCLYTAYVRYDYSYAEDLNANYEKLLSQSLQLFQTSLRYQPGNHRTLQNIALLMLLQSIREMEIYEAYKKWEDDRRRRKMRELAMKIAEDNKNNTENSNSNSDSNSNSNNTNSNSNSNSSLSNSMAELMMESQVLIDKRVNILKKLDGAIEYLKESLFIQPKAQITTHSLR